ncbi:MAG: hypothetical protein RLY93_08350 [Sumerlaeia bacterium]
MRAEHKGAFDRIFTRARRHSAESAAAARAVPFEALVFAVLLEMELELKELRAELEAARKGTPEP